MKDKEFLCWIHERFEHVYKESPLVDFLRRLRDIIETTPESKDSFGKANYTNSLEEIKKKSPRIYMTNNYLKSCEVCKFQEGRHYCLLLGKTIKNMDTKRRNQWEIK